MADLQRASELLERGQLEQLEDRWLGHATDRPEDLDYLVGVAELLAGAGARDRARFLLELLDEQLRGDERWQARLELLRRAGTLYLEPASVHEEVMASLRRIYHGCPSLDGLIEKTGLLRAIEDLPRVWTKVQRLAELMQFEVGTVVWMEGKGAGRVAEVNLELDSFKIELERHPGLRVGFAAASKLLQPLPASHIERRKLEELDELKKLQQRAPGELLLATLRSYDRPLTATEIRNTLGGVVAADEWSGWWSEARRHPQVLTFGSKGRPTYGWATSKNDALEVVRRRFADGDVDTKLRIFRSNVDRSVELAEEMGEELETLADGLRAEQPALALLIWHALEKSGQAGELAWSPESMLRTSEDPARLLTTLPDRAIRERLYRLCIDKRSDWPAVFRRAMEDEEDPRLLSFLAERLANQDPAGVGTFIDDVLSHPRRRAAAFVWLAENADSVALVGDRNPLRLLRQILDALHQREFSSFQSRLLRTFERGGAATQLLTRLSERQAMQAQKALARAPIEEHLRDTLRKFLHVKFPALDDSRETPLYATPKAIEGRRRELQRLVETEIPANRRAIEEARAHGDLRENFEYNAARQRHEYLNSRVAALQRDLSRVRPFEARRSEFPEARLGCRLDLTAADGETRSVTILGPWESDPDRGIVSYDSELGQEILGKKLGESITLGNTTWEVTAIGPWD